MDSVAVVRLKLVLEESPEETGEVAHIDGDIGDRGA